MDAKKAKRSTSNGERRERRSTSPPPPLPPWAPVVLPYLDPASLGSAAQTCKSFHQIAASITARRTLDATRGLETHAIPFLNPVDSEPYAYFRLYAPSPVVPALDFEAPPDSGCACDGGGGCAPGSGRLCPCGWARPEFGGEGPVVEVMSECGPGCGCGLGCGNRSTQRGIAVRMAVVKDRRKGWGLHAKQFVQRGTFVCEYAGELLTTVEAQRRQSIYDSLTKETKFFPALLVVREHLPSGKACLRINIDATRVGNIARFINHSCDGGNLLPILVRNSSSPLPRVCFFSVKDIRENEELTFSYGDARLNKKGQPCFCGTPECLGMLPSEET